VNRAALDPVHQVLIRPHLPHEAWSASTRDRPPSAMVARFERFNYYLFRPTATVTMDQSAVTLTTIATSGCSDDGRRPAGMRPGGRP